jgi:hypothetical protein
VRLFTALLAILLIVIPGIMLGVRSEVAILSPSATNPYANPHSQAVANWVVNNMYNAQVNMLSTDPSPGCVDSNAGVTVACDDAFWTTSDNLPTCATLIDFGYASISEACINKILGCNSVYVPSEWRTTTCPKNPLSFEFTASGIPASDQAMWLSGWRYEAYFAIPIPVGAPGDEHFIVSVGTLGDGQAYAIKADIATLQVGTASYTGAFDVVAPQCIDEYLRGNLAQATECANDLIGTWNGIGVGVAGSGGTYSTWQLGQAMFVMRVLGQDSNSSKVSTSDGTITYSALFNAMESRLWAVQAAYSCPVGGAGCLPNSYNSANQGSGGTDGENQDAGLLPFSSSVIDYVQSAFGECGSSSAPPGGASSNLCRAADTSTGASSATSTSSKTSSGKESSTELSSTLTSTSSSLQISTGFDSSLSSDVSTAAPTSTSSAVSSEISTTSAGNLTDSASEAEGSFAQHQSLEALKVQTTAVTMGTGAGALVFLAGLFPLSYVVRTDARPKRRRKQRRVPRGAKGIASGRSDISRARIGRG